MAITLFNRKQLFTALSDAMLFRVQNALAGVGIACAVRTPGIMGAAATRGRGVPGVNQAQLYSYEIYVQKQDYDRAYVALQSCLRKD